MGEKKSRLIRFQESHPFCCFCGGSSKTETIDHLPPKSVYIGSQIPAKPSIEFPACKTCNQGTSQFDQAASLIANISPEMNEDELNHLKKLLSGVRNNAGSISDSIVESLIGNRQLEREMSTKIGKTIKVARLKEPALRAIRVLAAKLSYAYYYDIKKKIVPSNGVVISDIILSAPLIKDDSNWITSDNAFSFSFTDKKVFMFRYRGYSTHNKDDLIFEFRINTHICCIGIAISNKDKYQIEEDSHMTFLPGFISSLVPPQKSSFSTQTKFQVV